VTILDDGQPVPSCPPTELSNGQVTCSPGSNASGPFTAGCSGDATFDGSSATSTGVGTVVPEARYPVVLGVLAIAAFGALAWRRRRSSWRAA